MLDEAIGQCCAVLGPEGIPQRGDRPQFLAEPAAGGLQRRLARPRMSAAGIRPEPGRMVFEPAAALQQQPSLSVDEEDGKCPMAEALPVDPGLTGLADRAIAGINKNQLFAHGFSRVRALYF